MRDGAEIHTNSFSNFFLRGAVYVTASTGLGYKRASAVEMEAPNSTRAQVSREIWRPREDSNLRPTL